MEVTNAPRPMDRTAILNKIRAMMNLESGSSFEGEADNASRMIDMLCEKYGLDRKDALNVQILQEIHSAGNKNRDKKEYTIWIYNAVAKFYDARLIIRNDQLVVVGSEAQQIQTKLYFEFIHESMMKEAKKAYKAEKLLAELMGKKAPTPVFMEEFKVAFAMTVRDRLEQLKKEQNRVHEHAEQTLAVYNGMALRRRRGGKVRLGEGAAAGACAGGNVSLNKQTSGSSMKQLSGV